MVGKLKQHWREGKTAFNGWLTIPHAFAAELMAAAGWDCLTIDMQHGLFEAASLLGALQAIQPRETPVLVRVPWNEPGIIGKALDAGAEGIICPMIDNPEQAAALVRACRYPPLGARSMGPVRAGLYGPPIGQFREESDLGVACLPMIETRSAFDGLEAILDVPGVDGVYVGPNDLGLALGHGPGMDRTEPEILAAYVHIVAACTQRGLVAGVHTASAAYAKRAEAMGFRLVTGGADSGFVLGGARATLASIRAGNSAP